MNNQQQGAVTAEEMDNMLNLAFKEFDVDGSGFMDVTELENLCRRLNTPLNPSETQSAQRQLDTDGSGRVELFEFKNWWLGKIVFAEQSLNQKMASVKNKGNRLLQAKLARKQAEADAQLLANRIALLQQEEAKAWKKIQQTKVRAQDILETRESADKQRQNKVEFLYQKDEHTRIAQESRFVQKQRDKAKRQQAQAGIIKKKQQDVQLLRQQRRQNEIEKQRQRQAERERNQYNKQVVREHERQLALKKDKLRNDQRKLAEVTYKKKCAAEDEKTANKEREVVKMEKQEMELIQRLQNAQMLQKEAYKQLEDALVQAPGR